jgi:hypothetical protein
MHTRYTAAVDFDVECRCWRLKLDAVTVSGRLKPDDLDLAFHEVGRTVLVDHAFVVAGGEITKAARSFIGRALDTARRSQIMFIDREDIMNRYVANNLPLPTKAQPPPDPDPWGNLPF